MSEQPTGWRRHLWFLVSRKVQVAVATIVVAVAAQYGLQLSEIVVGTVLGVGVALILGIAAEDAGQKAGTTTVSQLLGLLKALGSGNQN